MKDLMLAEVFTVYIDRFEHFLLDAISSQKYESIHQLRITIKRLRALILFLEESGITMLKKSREHQELRSLFKLAGNYREMQINLKLISKYESWTRTVFPEIKKEFRRILEIRRELLIAGLKEYSLYGYFKLSGDIRDEIIRLSNKKFLKHARQYTRHRIRQIHGYTNPDLFEKNLHMTRSLIKEINFVLQLAVHCECEEMILLVRFDRIKWMEDKLGEWHDRIVLSLEIKDFLDRIPYDRERTERYLELIKQLEKDNIKTVLQLHPEVELESLLLKSI